MLEKLAMKQAPFRVSIAARNLGIGIIGDKENMPVSGRQYIYELSVTSFLSHLIRLIMMSAKSNSTSTVWKDVKEFFKWKNILTVHIFLDSLVFR